MTPEQFLTEQGAPPHVVTGGAERLVERWETCAQRVLTGADEGEDFGNDLDARRWLECLMRAVPADGWRARVHRADVQFLRGTYALRECFWGDKVAAEEGWNPAEHWWYFRRPVSW